MRNSKIPIYRLSLAFAKELEWATLPNIHHCTYYKTFRTEEYHLIWPGYRCTYHATLTPSPRGALLTMERFHGERAVNREILVIPQFLLERRNFRFHVSA